jgi:hypothetical protein
MDIKNLIISLLIGFMYYSNGIFDDRFEQIFATIALIATIYYTLMQLDNSWNRLMHKKSERR